MYKSVEELSRLVKTLSREELEELILSQGKELHELRERLIKIPMRIPEILSETSESAGSLIKRTLG